MKRLRSRLLASAGSIAPIPDRQLKPPVAVPRFYYTETFAWLLSNHRADLDQLLVEAPLAFRMERLGSSFEAGELPDREASWGILRDYLDALEEKIAEIAARHSPAYWLHLYRRILPVLSSKHAGKTDRTTVALVRQIAELAYLKHGNQGRVDDLGPVSATSFSTFLDGQFRAATIQAFRSETKARRRYEEFKAVDQSVMIDFTVQDLLAAFQVEGLSYEYWKSAAAMRSLGKGANLVWDAESQWFVDQGGGLDPLLFAIFDHRIDGENGLHTRLGTWTRLERGEVDIATLYFTSYNANPEIENYPIWDAASQAVVHGAARLNFQVGQIALRDFAKGHEFMAGAFEKRHGVKLDAVLFCLWAACLFAFFPGRAIFAPDKDQQKSIILENVTNLRFRGYRQVDYDIGTIAAEAIWWASAARHEPGLSETEIQAGFEFLLLAPKSAALIGLWSGGKRPLLIPSHHGLMIDTTAIVPIVVNLFFGVRENSGAKGFAFEDSVRDMIRSAGVDLVFDGEIEFEDGTRREIDAAVRIGSRLILIECFSFEKPVDYELAKPGIFEARVARIQAKIEQARTLAARIGAARSGANFDFSWATEIDWRLVTPSVEFAWELSGDLFDTAGVPRVLQLGELRAWLAEGRNPTAPFEHLIRVSSG